MQRLSVQVLCTPCAMSVLTLAVVLRTPCAISSADVGYGPTHTLCDVRYCHGYCPTHILCDIQYYPTLYCHRRDYAACGTETGSRIMQYPVS
eukprot:2192277-Rhodomonas_salina.1